MQPWLPLIGGLQDGHHFHLVLVKVCMWVISVTCNLPIKMYGWKKFRMKENMGLGELVCGWPCFFVGKLSVLVLLPKVILASLVLTVCELADNHVSTLAK